MSGSTSSGNGTSTDAVASQLFSGNNSLSSTFIPSIVLDMKNFLHWEPQWRLAFENLDLLDLIDEPPPMPKDDSTPTTSETQTLNAWKKCDAKARQLIMKIVNQDIFLNDISHLPSAKDMWDGLTAIAKPKSAVGLVYWIRSLVNARYNDGEDLHKHLNLLQECVRNLNYANLKIPEKVLAALFLNTMPASYDNVANSLPDDKLSISDVKLRLLEVYRTRTERSAAETTDAALAASSLKCSNCKQTGHAFATCWSKSGGAEGQGPRKGRRGKKKKDKAKAAQDTTSTTNAEDSMFVADRAHVAIQKSFSAYVHGVMDPSVFQLDADNDAALIA